MASNFKTSAKAAAPILIGVAALGLILYYGGDLPGVKQVRGGLSGQQAPDGNPFTFGR